MNRFDLEEAMSNVDQISEDMETIIYAVGDSPKALTEDELLNMLIGVKQLHETRYRKMWSIFEQLISNKTISNETTTTIKLPPYDDGGIKMETST